MKLLLGDGLLTTDGDVHRRQRRLVQPAFHRQRVESYGDTMAQRAEELAGRWRDGSTVDVLAEMMGLTLVIVANTLFGATVDDEVEEIGSALTAVFEMFGFALMPSRSCSIAYRFPRRSVCAVRGRDSMPRFTESSRSAVAAAAITAISSRCCCWRRIPATRAMAAR
jgi:Cytochrome P450